MTRVAITGTGGSLGRALLARLVAGGHEVRGLVRNEKGAAIVARQGGTPVIGDVRSKASLGPLLQDAEVVFHLAAWMGKPFDEKLAYRVNVEGTRIVLREAAEAGVERVVISSSVAVYGPVRDGLVSEASPMKSVGDLYSDTKIEAERVASQEAESLGLELVILRPTMIYGPHSTPWTETPYRAIARGLPIVIGSGEDLLDALYVTDAARAFELAGFAEGVSGEVFIIGGEAVSWNAFMGHYARMAGTRLRRIPAPVARTGASLVAHSSKLLGKRPQVLPEMVGVMTSRARFAGEKARDRLGYAPEVSLSEGMARTKAWLRGRGELRRPTKALVTGAGGGLGRAVAEKLQRRGVTVWASDVRAEALSELAAKGVHTLELDVTSPTSIERALATIRESGGPVDLLVNVAGLAKPGAIEAQPWEDVELQFEVNAFGPLRLSRALAPAMRERGYGRILNVSSTNGFVVTPFMGAYSASKYALEAFSDALRLELAPWGVEVVLIQPGAMKTPFAARAQEALQREAEASGAWRAYLEGFQKSPMWGTQNASDPAKVAEVIVRAAFAKRTAPRVLATLDALPSRAVSMLPARLRDGLFRRLSGLHRVPAAASAEAANGREASPRAAPAEKTGSS